MPTSQTDRRPAQSVPPPPLLFMLAVGSTTSLAAAIAISLARAVDVVTFTAELLHWWPICFLSCLAPLALVALFLNRAHLGAKSSADDDARGVLAAEQTGLVIALITIFALTITLGEVVFAIAYFMQSPTAERSVESIGSYMGGAAAMAGFVWIIAGFWVQSRELLLQRHELLLQRRAIERSAAAAQMEIALTLRAAYLRRLGETAGHIARALYTPEERVDADIAATQGNVEAFIHWLLRTSDFEDRLKRTLPDDLVTASFVQKYIDYDAEYIAIIQKTEIEHRLVSDTLKVDAPSILARALRNASSKVLLTPLGSAS